MTTTETPDSAVEPLPESVRLWQFVNDIKAALRPYDITGSNDFSGRTTSEVVSEVIDAVNSLEAWEVAREVRAGSGPIREGRDEG